MTELLRQLAAARHKHPRVRSFCPRRELLSCCSLREMTIICPIMNVKCCAVVGKCAARQDLKCLPSPCLDLPQEVLVYLSDTGSHRGKNETFKECAAEDSTLFSTLSCLFCPSVLFLSAELARLCGIQIGSDCCFLTGDTHPSEVHC